MESWMLAKFALVAALTASHQVFARWRSDFAADRNRHPARVFRIANEAPTLLMIGIVVLVIVRPF
jgi:putative membrane protein